MARLLIFVSNEVLKLIHFKLNSSCFLYSYIFWNFSQDLLFFSYIDFLVSFLSFFHASSHSLNSLSVSRRLFLIYIISFSSRIALELSSKLIRWYLVFFIEGLGYTIFNFNFSREVGDYHPIDCNSSARITNSLSGPSDSVSETISTFLPRFGLVSGLFLVIGFGIACLLLFAGSLAADFFLACDFDFVDSGFGRLSSFFWNF